MVEDAGTPTVRAVFEPGPLPMRFGDVPWPDDGYRDGAGRVRVRDVPTQGDAAFVTALADGMAELDGFGVRPTIYFRFDGALDPSSLPQEPEATLPDGASVFLVDADTSSPDAFERVPVDVSYDAERHELRLRPAFQRALAPGRVYAAVVTRGVRAENGRAIEGAERFVAIRDAAVAPADPFDRAARARYAPLLAALESRVLPRNRVAALAVFRVQSVGGELLATRAALRGADPEVTLTEVLGVEELDGLLGMPPTGAAGLDDGAPHDHIGFVVHGSFTSPNLLSTKAGVHGAFERTASGEPRVKRHDEVPFTLILPRTIIPDVGMPVVLVQHDLLGDRSDALALANTLAASGYAVFAVDAPFHGMRSGMGDRRHRFTDAALPDGFGDGAGDFAGARDAEGELTPLHPFYYRDAVRQGVIDLMQFVHVVETSDWAESASALEPALAGLVLDTRRVGFAGIGLGADMGAILATYEPDIGPVLLAAPAGSGLDGWIDSPARRPMFDAVLERLALDAESAGVTLRPELDLWRALSDRGTAAAHASRLREANVDALVLMARDDEVTHNAGTEALAHALGAQMVGGPAQYVPDLALLSVRPGMTVAGNHDLGNRRVTRVLYVFDPATHAALVYAQDSIGYRHPLNAPFRELPDPMTVANPTAGALRQAAFFFESYRACRTAANPAACTAAVMVPPASSP